MFSIHRRNQNKIIRNLLQQERGKKQDIFAFAIKEINGNPNYNVQ